MGATYAEKLKDPRWQKRRLVTLERAGWRCERCGSEDKCLNVHHLYYRRGAAPWDYPDDALRVLCDGCHGRWHEERQALLYALVGCHDQELVIGFAAGSAAATAAWLGVAGDDFITVRDCSWVSGFVAGWNCSIRGDAPAVSAEEIMCVSDLEGDEDDPENTRITAGGLLSFLRISHQAAAEYTRTRVEQ